MCFFVVARISSISYSQNLDFQKLEAAFKQDRPWGQNIPVDHHETVWLILTIKDSTVVHSESYFQDSSKFRSVIKNVLHAKINGFKFNNDIADKIIIPLLVGSFTNKNFELVKSDWKYLESLKIDYLKTNGEDAIRIFPIYNVIGTYAPPKRSITKPF